MKTIINFCPTGMIPTKEMTPHVPISPTEIIEQTHQAYEIGITIAHLHARDQNGIPTYKKNIFQQIFEGVKKYCPDLIVCFTTSGRNSPEFEKRSEVIELKPDMASLTLSSLNFIKTASLNAPDMIKALVNKMNKYGVNPELECFDMGMINYGNYLIKKELIKGPFYWNLLFGNIAGFQPNLTQISTALNEIPKNHFISLAGLGTSQLKVSSIAIASNLGVRIGIEDNLWFDDKKSKLVSNIALVKRIHQLMSIHESTLMQSKELGQLGFYNKFRNSR